MGESHTNHSTDSSSSKHKNSSSSHNKSKSKSELKPKSSSKHKTSNTKHKSNVKLSLHKTNKVIKAKHPITTKDVKKHYSKKFCPNCGNAITDNSTLCKNCRTTEFNFKDIKIFLCTNCKSYNHRNKWQRFTNLNSVVDKILTDTVKQSKDTHNKNKAKYVHMNEETVNDLLSFKAGVHKDITITISINKELFDLPASFDVTLCPKCSKRGTKYFEGILQTRNITDEIRQFIKNDIQKQRSKGIHINNEIIVEGENLNIDYYYTDKGYLKVIAEKLRNTFGATLKHNAQLFSIDWETSKNLYRLNLLVEFPKYNKNDVLKINSELYIIVSMDEKIHVMNLKNNTKTLLSHKDSYEILRGVEVILIKKYPEFEVLDPNTYYQARLMNPTDTIQINQKLKVIIDGSEAWMIKQ